MKQLLAATALLVVAAATAAGEPDIVRVHTRDRAEIAWLATQRTHLGVNRAKGIVTVEADDELRAALAARRLAFEVDAEATAAFRAWTPRPDDGIPGFSCYRTVAETNARLDALAAQFPNLLTLVDAGDSWERTQSAAAGEDLRVARITNAAVPGPKPALFVTTGIHPRELPTAELGLRFVEKLLLGYGVDPDATWIVDHHEVHMMVLANPDARKRAETGLSWRKNTNNNFCANSNTRGIDLNRNFAWQWGGLGASTSPCNETFRGPTPGSEPETVAIDAYQRLLFPDRRGPALTDAAPADTQGIYIDVHNNAAQVLWPYGIDETTVAPNDAQLARLGRRLAWFDGYEPVQINGLYPASGSTADNSYGELGVASYAIELGGSGFSPSCASFEASISPDNLGTLMYAARVVRAPYLLPAGPDVRDAIASPPLAFPGDVVRVAAVADDTRYNQSNGVEPTQAIAAVRAVVDALPWLPASPSQTLAASDGAFDASTEAVSGDIATTGLAVGRHVAYLQARDASGSDGPVSAVFVHVVDPATNGTLAGSVRTPAGAPLVATVRANAYTALSDSSGAYRHRLPPGAYALDVSASHYERATVPGLAVAAGATTTRDVTLYALCPRATQDAQSGLAGWTTQVTSGTNTWGVAPAIGAFATSHWTESVSGNYANNIDTSLVSPAIDLSGWDQARLSFDVACATEATFDFGRVEVRTGPAAAWTQVWQCSGALPKTRVELDLPQLAGAAQAQLRFRVTSDTGVVGDGVRIDDVLLEAASATCRGAQGAVDPLFSSGFE